MVVTLAATLVARIVVTLLEAGRVNPRRVVLAALTIDARAVLAMALNVPGEVRRPGAAEAADAVFIMTGTWAAVVRGHVTAMRRMMLTPGLIWPAEVMTMEFLPGATRIALREVRGAKLVTMAFAGAAMGKVLRSPRSVMAGASVRE